MAKIISGVSETLQFCQTNKWYMCYIVIYTSQRHKYKDAETMTDAGINDA